MIKYSIIIPVYNSVDSLAQIVEIASKSIESYTADFEIIFIDDDSPNQNTWPELKKLRQQNSKVKIIRLRKNHGQHKAILCGFQHAQGEFIITMDDDLQHPPEEISKLIEGINNHPEVDVVIGAYESKQHNFFRNLGTNVLNRITSYVFDKPLDLKLTSFRIMRKCIAEEVLDYKTYHPRIGNILLQVTSKIINVKVKHDSRHYGRSGYTLRRLFADAITNIISNSALPLKLVSYLGFFCSIVSILLTIYFLAKRIFVGISIPGWTTIFLALTFFFGILFFTLGIIGEYLSRILLEVTGSKKIIIKENVGMFPKPLTTLGME